MVKKMICSLLVLPIYFIIFMILSMFNIYLFEGPWYISIPIIVIFPLIGTILVIINYNKRINYPALFIMIFFVIMGLICYYKTYMLNPNYDTLTYFIFFIIFAILYRISTIILCYKMFKKDIIYTLIIYMLILVFVIIFLIVMGG